MIRRYQSFDVKNIDLVKQQMLSWGNQFNICCFLDSHHYPSRYSSLECLLAVGEVRRFETGKENYSGLTNFLESNQDWILGHFGFELYKHFNGSAPCDAATQTFGDCFLFVPEVVVLLQGESLTIGSIHSDTASVFDDLQKEAVIPHTGYSIDFRQRISREEYICQVNHLLRHIKKGDCYEINFCLEFNATANINPVSVYSQLGKISPNPFSAYYRVDENCLLCASPERYLKKLGDKLVSQPIKGTARRDPGDPAIDAANKNGLRNSEKERRENVIVVDLVRNDLSKVCAEGSVLAEELFKVCSFPQVHQMISSVSGALKPGIGFNDILTATFPMGSMTGAPKKKVLELIETYEQRQRGIYSGAVGYFTPAKDFDFNVVIRSIVYNLHNSTVSFHTGSAITASSDPEKEYEECLLKAQAILKVFSGSG